MREINSGKKLLYHYRPLNKLEHLDHLKNFLNQKIWFTRMDKLNDPFESYAALVKPTPDQILESPFVFNEYYQFSKKENPQLSEKELRKTIKENKDKLTFKNNFTWVEDEFKKYGISCFSDSSSNIPMWSHYADYHRGYCVVFELDIEKIRTSYFPDLASKQFDEYVENIFSPFSEDKQEIFSFCQSEDDDKKLIFTKVIYTDNFPEMHVVKFIELNKKNNHYEMAEYIAKNCLGRKFKQWAYEEEYRLIVNTNSEQSDLLDLRGYPFLKVTKIIMGEKLGQSIDIGLEKCIPQYDVPFTRNLSTKERDFKHFVASLAKEKNIEVELAKSAKNEYKITSEKYQF